MNKLKFHRDQVLKMTRSRGEIYNVLLRSCASIPDQAFMEHIYSEEYWDNLAAFKKLQDKKITKGVDLTLEFLKENQEKPSGEVIETLGVDRTRIIRIPHTVGLKAPYESQYIKTQKANDILLNLKKAYLEAGFTPYSCSESLDFIGVELDFLRLINRTIIKDGTDESRLFQIQHRFISKHIGKWASEYCNDAMNHAETKFYKGWLHLLSGFISLDLKYLDIMSS